MLDMRCWYRACRRVLIPAARSVSSGVVVGSGSEAESSFEKLSHRAHEADRLRPAVLAEVGGSRDGLDRLHGRHHAPAFAESSFASNSETSSSRSLSFSNSVTRMFCGPACSFPSASISHAVKPASGGV